MIYINQIELNNNVTISHDIHEQPMHHTNIACITRTLHASHQYCTNITVVNILVGISQLPDISFVEFQGTRPMEELRDVQETGLSKYLHLQCLGDALVIDHLGGWMR